MDKIAKAIARARELHTLEGDPVIARGAVWFISRHYLDNKLFSRRTNAVVVTRNGYLDWLIDTACDFIVTLDGEIEDWGAGAIDEARQRGEPPIDGVPWEIHEIEDPIAREAATIAYKANAV